MRFGRLCLSTHTLALCGALWSALGATKALADNPRGYQQPFIWTGSTFGVQGVYGRSTATWYKGLLDGTAEGEVDQKGINYGAFMGMNYQTPWGIVVGGQIAFARGHVDKSACSVSPGANCQTNLLWYATPAARLGYAWGNVLVYGKAGVGVLDLVHQLRDGPAIPFSNSRVAGFAPLYGVGVDYAVTNNLIVGLEYNRLNCDVRLNHFRDPTGAGVAGADIDVCVSDLRLKAGIKF
jgi:outer membrane immunogenic protein